MKRHNKRYIYIYNSTAQSDNFNLWNVTEFVRLIEILYFDVHRSSRCRVNRTELKGGLIKRSLKLFQRAEEIIVDDRDFREKKNEKIRYKYYLSVKLINNNNYK